MVIALKKSWVLPVLLLSSVLIISGCTALKTVLYSFKSTDHFIEHSSDSRVFYESGAEVFAAQVVSELPGAVRKVEQGHFNTFQEHIIIYVCESHESYKTLTGRKAKAIMHRKKIFLSPAILEQPETMPLYLAHELSHLMMIQKTGGYRYIKIPSWFHEGLAAFISGGGGAHNVTDEEAVNSIINEKHFLPHESAGIRDLVSPRYASYWKLDHHMFYRQGMVFVQYLINFNEKSFKTFLLNIQNGNDFSESFHTTFGMTTMEMWDEFVKNI